ncbi:hypothetical protein DYH09_30750 [bacterium CPR1]|nr:hypothetical protein [bacterium CPR1]
MTIKVNIMPREKAKWWHFDPLTVVLALTLVLGNLGMVGYGRLLTQRVVDSKERLTGLEAKIRQQEEQLPVLNQREERISKLERQIQAIKSLKDDPLRYAHLLTQVALVLPASVWLERLSIEPARETVALNGTVSDPLPMGTLATLVVALRQSGYFDHTELKTAVRKDHVFTFQLEAHYKPEVAARRTPGKEL